METSVQMGFEILKRNKIVASEDKVIHINQDTKKNGDGGKCIKE